MNVTKGSVNVYDSYGSKIMNGITIDLYIKAPVKTNTECRKRKNEKRSEDSL